MSLANIFSAIKAQAGNEISNILERNACEREAYTRKTDAAIAEFQTNLDRQTLMRKEQMTRRARTMVEMERKRVLLEEKRAALDAVYAAALAGIKKLPEEKLKKLEKQFEKNIMGQDGDILKSEDGGFVFVSANREEDFTFPHLVHNVLRPATELEISSKLFS